MKLYVEKTYADMSRRAAEVVAKIVKNDPHAVLGLATGTTPLGLYDELARMHAEEGLSFKDVTTVNLDEYVGLGENDDQSYVYFMRKNLFNKIDVDLKNTNLPNGLAKDFDAECKRYDAVLKQFRQSVQVLGIGSNGHIGFNEPNTPFDSTTHIVTLTESTVKDNARLFNDISEVPRRAITMGIKNVMDAECVLLIANGKAKARAIYRALKEKPSEEVPASVLQYHKNAIVIVDEEAASLL